MLIPTTDRTARIRQLNDALRTTFTGGRLMLTRTVADLPHDIREKVMAHVRHFSEFNGDNDPHKEHDCAFFDVGEGRYFFKVDYYDLNLEFGSEDPADFENTCRVLTIGHESDW